MIEDALRFGDQQELFRENKSNQRYVSAVKDIIDREMKLFKARGKFQQNFDPNSTEARIYYLDQNLCLVRNREVHVRESDTVCFTKS